MSTKYSGPPVTVTCPDCGFTRTGRTPGIAGKSLEKHSCEHQYKLQARAARVEARKTREGIKRDCACKNAQHVHGTRTAYVVDKCRCRQCTDASTEAQSKRNKDIAFGRHDVGRVPADPVRAHVAYLAEQGISAKQLAKLSGVSYSAIGTLMYGRPERGHGLYPRVAATTAERLLAVKPSLDNMADGRAIDATGTVRRLQALVAIGYSQARLGKQLGIEKGNVTALFNADKVTARRARQVKELFDRCWNRPQAGTDWHSKSAATRAKNLAAARGWVSPLAWDEDTIDDPAAVPDTGEKPQKQEASAENIEFMLSTGATREEISARLGAASWETIERRLHRIHRGDLVAAAKNDTRDNARHASKGRAA